MLIQLVRVSYATGSLPVLDAVDLSIAEGTRVGVVGENGSGKTTLLRLLAGELRPDAGEAVRKRGLRLAALAQDDRDVISLDATVEEHLLRSDAEAALERIGAEMAAGADGDAERLAELGREYDRALDALGTADSPDRAVALEMLADLGLRELGRDRPLGELSGGQRRLVELVRLLALRPDLLLLDEPEAHLDLAARGWLAGQLARLPSAVVVVSHDRHLLDSAVREIVDVGGGRCERYAGNYSYYLEEHPRVMARREHEFRLATSEVQRLQEQVYMYRQWCQLNDKFASRARQRMKMLEKAKQRVERPVPRQARTMRLAFSSQGAGRIMASAEGAVFSYDAGARVGPLDVVLERGDQVALIGANGIGKSTLLNLLDGTLAPQEGSVRVKQNARLAHMTQESLSQDLERTPLELVCDAKPLGRDDAIRRLCALGLSYSHCVSPLGNLSGGQRVRVHLLHASLLEPDLLLLDEPTNYVDTQSAEVVQEALSEFRGCVVAATHDRYFVETFATRVLVMERGPAGARLRESTLEELAADDRFGLAKVHKAVPTVAPRSAAARPQRPKPAAARRR